MYYNIYFALSYFFSQKLSNFLYVPNKVSGCPVFAYTAHLLTLQHLKLFYFNYCLIWTLCFTGNCVSDTFKKTCMGGWCYADTFGSSRVTGQNSDYK